MFIDATSRRNPQLIRAAVTLHRRGVVPANTFILDLDAVIENARLIKAEADRAGLRLYFMAKQLNRNPLVARAIAAAGIERAVAVEPAEARTLAAAGVALGNVGHLVQTTSGEIDELLSLRPEVMTVFSVDKARQVSEAARRLGIVQDILLRVAGPDDFFYAGQEGGIEEAELGQAAAAVAALPGVRLSGVTAFPCLVFDQNAGLPVPTNNLATVGRAATTLRRLGVDVQQVNAPSLTCVGTIPALRKAGATHGEPGHSLTGTTPWHAVSDQPERPALVYVTEVAHTFRGRVFTFGGGFYMRSRAESALVGRAADGLARLSIADSAEYHIDYYGALSDGGRSVAVGDTAVYAFRAQLFTARSHLAVVSGLASGAVSEIRLFDQANHELPLPAAKAGDLL